MGSDTKDHGTVRLRRVVIVVTRRMELSRSGR